MQAVEWLLRVSIQGATGVEGKPRGRRRQQQGAPNPRQQALFLGLALQLQVQLPASHQLHITRRCRGPQADRPKQPKTVEAPPPRASTH